MTVLFAAFQLLSLGILPFGANKHITADVTLITAGGGEPKDFNSVRFPWNNGKNNFKNQVQKINLYELCKRHA